jgi:hypothetical protein
VFESLEKANHDVLEALVVQIKGQKIFSWFNNSITV